jgi:uncharacterized protein (DUF58 family)
MVSGSDTRLRLGLTEAGKVILHGIGFVALAALVFPAFGVLSVLVWVVLVAFLAGFVLRPKIRLSGNLPDCVMAGQTVRLTYVLENVGRFAAYNLWLKFGALPEAIEQLEDGQVISRLGPGQSVEMTVAIRPMRRGYYLIGQPVCLSSFPFNLFTFGISRQDQSAQSGLCPIIVLPTFSRLRISTRGPSRQACAGSTRLTGRMGFFPEYAGNRPFLPGDSPRQIDSRAWARLSVPATKEYHDDFDNCAAFVLDTVVPEALLRSKPKEIRELEAAVSLCASLAFSINDACLIDLLVAGPDLHQFTDRPRAVRLDRIQEILAGVEPSAGYSLEQIESAIAARFYGISDVFFILLGWRKTYETLLEAAGRAGCRSVVLFVGGPDDPSLGAGLEQDLLSQISDVRVVSADQVLAAQLEGV